MPRRLAALLALPLLLVLLLVPLPARGGEPAPGEPPAPAGDAAPEDGAPALDDPRYLPLEAVVPGMRGHGFTVKSGTTLERFEVEVIDVAHNWLAKQDLILVRCLGEAFADHQIAQGMSGSPVYLDGRLAGALSYTFSWAKHAVGGVTPIHAMLAEGRRTWEGRPTGALPPSGVRAPERSEAGAASFRPIGTPLALGGFSTAGRARLAEDLRHLGLSVVAAPGGGAPMGGALEAPVEPGATITVDILRGDFSASAVGTITAVDGDLVYAFGHPFETLGETLLPCSVGYVNTIIASREISFKLGGPVREIGALVQDRPSCIVCDRRRTAPMVPVRATFRNPITRREETFRFEVTPNLIFFQPMLQSALREAFTKAEGTIGPNTKRARMTVKLEGMEPWSYEDAVAGFDAGFQRMLMHLVDRPLTHFNQRPRFESFELDVEVEHTDRRSILRAVVASKDEVRPGDTVVLTALLEDVEPGPLRTERLEVVIPDDAPEGNYEIAVTGGDNAPADAPSPQDIADLPALYASFHRATELVAILPRAQVDIDVDGRLLRRLPLSSLPRLVRSPDAHRLAVRGAATLVKREVGYLVAGGESVVVRVVR